MIIERNNMGEMEISLDEGESFSHSSIVFKGKEGEGKLESIRIYSVKSLRLDDSIKNEAVSKGYSEYEFER